MSESTTWKEAAKAAPAHIEPQADTEQTAVVSHTEAQPPAVAQPSDQFGQLIAAINKLIENPELDLDRLERFLAMGKELRADRARADYTAAFAAMQADMPVIDENGGIKNKNGDVTSTYAFWEDINEAIKPVLSRHGFALDFPKLETRPEIGVSVTVTLAHTSGHEKSLTLDLPMDEPYGKNTIQRYASAMSYGKRYGAMAMLNIVSRNTKKDDDDGNSTSGENPLVALSISQIDLCENVAQCREWRAKMAAEVAERVTPKENHKVVAHYQLRLKRCAEAEGLA